METISNDHNFFMIKHKEIEEGSDYLALSTLLAKNQ